MNNDQPDEAINRRIAELEGWKRETRKQFGDGPVQVRWVNPSGQPRAWLGESFADSLSLPDYPNDYEAAVRAWEKLIPEWVVGPCVGGGWVANTGFHTSVEAPTFTRVICLAIIHQHGAE